MANTNQSMLLKATIFLYPLLEAYDQWMNYISEIKINRRVIWDPKNHYNQPTG